MDIDDSSEMLDVFVAAEEKNACICIQWVMWQVNISGDAIAVVFNKDCFLLPDTNLCVSSVFKNQGSSGTLKDGT